MKYKHLAYLAAITVIAATACKGKTGATGKDSTATTTTTTTDSTVKTDTAKKTMADVKPKGPAPAWAPDMKPQMQAVIEKLASYGDKPIETLTPAEARKNHTPADAVKDVMKDNNIPVPVFNVDTTGKNIPVDGGMIHIRIYTPKSGNGPFPVVVYYHGGGFVIAGIEPYDASPNVVADQLGAVVISVGYRLSPEKKFPVPINDGFAAYKWALANAASIKGDPKHVAVMGESAGGNMAVNTAIMARDKGVQLPSCVVAVYPVAGADMTTPSYVKNANAKPLNKAMMAWFVKYYTNTMAEAKDPRINLVAANLKGLPPTTVITDEIDPLQSEGMTLVQKLKAAGVQTDSKNYDGVTHEFFGMGALVPEAKDAEAYAVSQLKKGLGM